MKLETLELIKKYASEYDLDNKIVYGVVMQESRGDQFAVRYEKHYKWIEDPKKHKPNICSTDTEIELQKMSFGLMQMMGGVFRQLGFEGWLTKVMIDPYIQLDYGCRFLARKIKRYGLKGGVCSYNSGSPIMDSHNEYRNIGYYDKVISYSKELK